MAKKKDEATYGEIVYLLNKYTQQKDDALLKLAKRIVLLEAAIDELLNCIVPEPGGTYRLAGWVSEAIEDAKTALKEDP